MTSSPPSKVSGILAVVTPGPAGSVSGVPTR